jgi:xanthine dehydrogenase D subunit
MPSLEPRGQHHEHNHTMSTTTITSTLTRAPRIGESAPRPDGSPKVQGAFAFGSDLWAEGMLWGKTLRSPHASARIRSIDVTAAQAMVGVRCVLTHRDVPGLATFGLDHPDQPVMASDVVRFHGEPIAVVAADHPETARRAIEAIIVDYEILDPLVDAELALTAPPLHPDGNIFRQMTIRHGDADLVIGPELVSVEGTYEVGMQDQAFMGPECGLAIPSDDGGVELYISTQWLHVDRAQVAKCLALPEDMVRFTLAGVGGAFGGREDVSLQVHCCLLALRTGRPVKMIYSRDESFVGHVHRHPARMWYRHVADRSGQLLKVEARLVFDGGAYTSSSPAVISNAVCFAAGPYRVPNAHIYGVAVRTNNPPCGAMRGFGAVQTCFAHEAQMDALAAALDIDPIELRLLNALAPGDRLITGQRIDGTAPVRELIRLLADAPLPSAQPSATAAMMSLPGGAGRTALASDVRRGVGFAVGFKNLLFSESFDDFSTASCEVRDGVATITCACAEVGQGFVTLAQQIAREILGVELVILAPPATATIGSAGSTSASRQTWMSGGAVMRACEAVRDDIVASVAAEHGCAVDTLVFDDGVIRSLDGTVATSVAEQSEERSWLRTIEYHHAPTEKLDANGQGNAHVSFAFAAHRAVVDVDPELGLVRVIEIATTQDVGRLLNPLQAIGQIEGGIAQGVGLAVMEEMILTDGKVRNASFTDYIIPTALDMPEVRIVALIEEPEPGAPFGAKGIGEPPTVSSSAAVAAAIRNATGLALRRIPVRPEHIALARA